MRGSQLLLLALLVVAAGHAALAQLAAQPSETGGSTSGGGLRTAGSSGDEAAGSLSREIIRTPAQGAAGGPGATQQQMGAGPVCANGLSRVQCLVDPCALSSEICLSVGHVRGGHEWFVRCCHRAWCCVMLHCGLSPMPLVLRLTGDHCSNVLPIPPG